MQLQISFETQYLSNRRQIWRSDHLMLLVLDELTQLLTDYRIKNIIRTKLKILLALVNMQSIEEL